MGEKKMNKSKNIFPEISDTEKWNVVDDEVYLYYGLNTEVGFIHGDLKRLDKATQGLVRRAILESICIHARNLCEIFTKEWNIGTDINIATLDDVWANDHQELIIKLRGAYNPDSQDLTPKDKFDKFLFHPTMNRRFVLYLENPLKLIHKSLTDVISALPADRVPSRGKYKNDFPSYMPIT